MPTEARIQELRGAIQALEPPGLLWTPRRGSNREKLLSAFAALGATFEEAVLSLLDEADPRTTAQLLPEWEEFLGLPDQCIPSSTEQSVSERRDAVISKLRSVGGCTKAFYIGLAADLGWAITITEFDQFHCGSSSCGDPLLAEDWAYTWQINAANDSQRFFHCGSSACGDPLSTFGNAPLECFFQRIKPAHTILIFSYT